MKKGRKKKINQTEKGKTNQKERKIVKYHSSVVVSKSDPRNVLSTLAEFAVGFVLG